jgi:predicted unusual protein kinase regulating ubiquinone biosynthesis (AarF/ABC1/UbiB family)
LAELGLLGRRHHTKADESESVRLRGALEELGPLFAGFGRYLGSRVDLLPLAACTTLVETRIPEAADQTADTAPTVARIDIEPSPIRRSFLHLWHRGVLEDEKTVILKTVRSGAVAALEGQIEELPVLEKLRLEDLADIGDAVESYLVWLERQFDLRQELRGLRRLASEAPTFDALVVPRLWEAYSDRETLVYSDPGGTALGEAYDLAADDDENRDRARRLCASWLQQVLLESVLPEGPPEENLSLLEDGRVAVTGGLFTSLGRQSRRGLLDALIATSRGDPDRACDHLLTACNADLEDSDRDRLRVLFRQAEPFRDGGWSETYHGRRLADTLCVQWRFLRREGVDIPQSVVSYLRSLHQVETCARRLGPDHDSFADAVDDLGVVAAASRLRETFSVRRVRGVLEATVPVLREMAQRADKLGGASEEDSNGSKSKSDARRKTWSEVAGLLLLMVATVVSAQGLRTAGVGGEWLQPATASVFVLLAVLALWRVWRHGG